MVLFDDITTNRKAGDVLFKLVFYFLKLTYSGFGALVALIINKHPDLIENCKLVSEGLHLTALHNHIVNEVPFIKYIHFSGNGDAVSLAGKIKSVISITGTLLTFPQPPKKYANPDWSKVEAIPGTNGKHNGKLLQYSFPRNKKLKEIGMEVPAYMGMVTGINLQ